MENRKEFAEKVLMSSLNGLYTYDLREGINTFINPQYTKLTGYTLQDLNQMSRAEFFALFHPEDQARVAAHMEEISHAADGDIMDIEYRFKTASGEWIWCLSRDTVFERSDDGTVAQIVGTFLDITERKRAEEELEEAWRSLALAHRQVQDIIDNTTSIVYAFDLEGRFLLANATLANLFDSTPEQMIGKRRHEIMPKDDADWHEANDRKVIETGKALEFEEYSQLKGRSITWLTTKFPLRDVQGGIYAVGGISADVSERKQMEEEIRRSRDELERRVHERTAELKRKNQELQEFAFVASHDLTEPLRKIQTFGELLKAKGSDHLSEVEKDYISRMTGASNRMQELLDALLSYSRIESKGGEFRPARLKDVVQAVTRDLEVGVRKVGAHVEINSLPTVNGDPNQLRQLFQNLISNALKYHRSEVIPRIKIFGEEDSGACRIFVEDNGIGFDEKYLEKIFQPFQRLHGKNEYSGAGIGLAICRKIVERHGGTITAKSTPGKGSTFIVTLRVRSAKS